MITLAIIIILLLVLQNILYAASLQHPHTSLDVLTGVVAALNQLTTFALCIVVIF